MESEAAVLDKVLALCREYWMQYKEPVPLKAIAQKWNKAAARLGFDLLDALRGDPRFVVDLSKSTAYRVAAVADVDIGALILGMLKRNGGVLDQVIVKRFALSAGHSVETIGRTLERLTAIGAVVLENDRISLNTDVD